MVSFTPVDKNSEIIGRTFSGPIDEVIAKLKAVDPSSQILEISKDYVCMIFGGVLYELRKVEYYNIYLTSTEKLRKELEVMEPVEV